jgi:hypothetical protein
MSSKSIYIPYTYLIGWSDHNKWYYGVRFAVNCNPNDLWKTYFTSSNIVKRFREEYGEPDIIQIRKTFANKNDAILWESKVLERLFVVKSEKWLNKTNNKAFSDDVRFSMKGKTHTKETREKLSLRRLGKENPMYGLEVSEKHRKKISEGNKGKKRTLEQKQRYSESRMGKNNPMYGKKHPNHSSFSGENNGMYGKKHSIETKEKMRESQKNKIWITDGISNRKVSKTIDMPSGWKRGRTL